MGVEIVTGDCRDVLKTLPNESVDCVVTSPPYFALRDYGVDGQMGLELTPEQFAAQLVVVFQEVRRVLRPEGTVWLNLGDPHTSATKEQEQAVDQAERRGIARGIEMSAVWLASKNEQALAAELRSAQIKERTDDV